jgi:hypothetical protein
MGWSDFVAVAAKIGPFTSFGIQIVNTGIDVPNVPRKRYAARKRNFNRKKGLVKLDGIKQKRKSHKKEEKQRGSYKQVRVLARTQSRIDEGFDESDPWGRSLRGKSEI